MSAVHFLDPQDYPAPSAIVSADVGLPFLEKVQRVALGTLYIGSVGIGLGLAGSWVGANVVIAQLAACGGIIGSIYGLYLVYQASCRLKQRIRDFTHIAAQIPQYPILRTCASVKNVLAQEPMRFSQSHHNHAFQQEVEVITEDLRNRGKVAKEWRTFLSHLHGTEVLYPDGTYVKLDMTLQMERSQAPFFHVETEMETINPQSAHFERDLDNLLEVLVESFGRGFHFTKDFCRSELSGPKDKCLIARQKGTGKILGLLWTKEEGADLQILRFARRADTPKLGIGEKLFDTFLSQDLSRFRNIVLDVRESNQAARALYEKKGFKTVSRKPSFYFYPSEDSLVMQKII